MTLLAPPRCKGFFDLEDLPKKTIVIGAGYIAVEMAGILNGLGSDVTLAIRHDEVQTAGCELSPHARRPGSRANSVSVSVLFCLWRLGPSPVRPAGPRDRLRGADQDGRQDGQAHQREAVHGTARNSTRRFPAPGSCFPAHSCSHGAHPLSFAATLD